MLTHIIENGLVVNTIVATIDEARIAFPEAVCADATEGAIGWRYVDGGFLPPEPLPQPVPASITMRQARLQLHAIGKLTAVQEAINQLPEPPKTEAQIEWDYAAVVERASPFVALLTPALGLSDEEMDDLFREAEKL